jgi:hypothetical protein
MVGVKIKWRGKLTAIAFCSQVVGGFVSCWPFPLLTEGGRLARPTEEQFNGKRCREKSLDGGRKNKKERQTHHHRLLHTAHKHGMAVAGSYSPCQPREGKLRHGWNNELIENAMMRIIGNGGEKRKQEANSPLLPSQCKSRVENRGGGIILLLCNED